jgi:hypothetical protein
MNEQTDQDKSAAYHDAGHLVAAHSLGLPYSGKRAISIIATEDYRGVFVHRNILRPDEIYTNEDRARLKMERLAVAKLAGIEAQRGYDPKSVNYGDGAPGAHWDGVSDYHEAVDLISHFVGPIEELEAYFNLLRIRARNLIQSKWLYVEAIAERLFEKKALSAIEAKQVISETTQARVSAALRDRKATTAVTAEYN